MARRKNTSQTKPPLKFDQKLVLSQWILSLFEAKDFEQLSKGLKAPEYEGLDEDNISRFYYVLSARLFQRKELTSDILLAYDQNIVRHWTTITDRRNTGGQILNMKYFQYLSLLFTEIYLDRYFQNENNESKGRGIGFFQDGGFYPDFILWLIKGDRQYVNFIDPHGLRFAHGSDDRKIQFYKTIKEIEIKLSAPDITLNSFIVTPTPHSEIEWFGLSKDEFNKCNVLFQTDDKDRYIKQLLVQIQTVAGTVSSKR